LFQNGLTGLDLSLQIERGYVDPMRGDYPDWKVSTTTKKKSSKSNDEKVTIVIDRERGIYSPNKFY
jgi:hypothetical protein